MFIALGVVIFAACDWSDDADPGLSLVEKFNKLQINKRMQTHLFNDSKNSMNMKRRTGN